MRLPTYTLCLCLLSNALTACDDGTSTGNPNQNPNGTGAPGDGTGLGGTETSGGNCKKVSAQELTLDAQTALGFSADDVLGFVEGEHDDTITWHPQDIASYGPESGEQSLKLTITHKGAPRLTKYTFNSGGLEFGGDCDDALEIDLDVALQTGQGALNEHFSTTLIARNAKVARLSLAPDPNALGGSFAVTEVHTAGFKLVQLFLNIELTPYGSSGQLQPTFEMRIPGAGGSAGAVAGSSSAVPLASWGPPRCEMGMIAVPHTIKVAGFSADDAIQLLDATHGTQLTFSGGTASAVTFAPFLRTGDFVCSYLEKTLFNPTTALGTLSISGTLATKSADGRIDAMWPVVLTATPDASGALSKLGLAFDGYKVPSTGTLLQRYGIGGVDVSMLDYSQAVLDVSLTPTTSLSGTLQVTGYDTPMCSSQVMTTPEGGSSSGGCMGATIVEVASATFSTP